ncbi:nitrilase-related carbon-nitrogen hydrolase [Candidatus Formimonas warabiya]|nr:nitrilase-related carbon-nitrogen hydrolase [Candidatus Formimonas warabiya]
MGKRWIFLIISCMLVFSFGAVFAADSNSNTGDLKAFKCAAVEFNPQLNERDENINDLYQVVETAAKNGAKLIVTPEMSTTGYYYKNRDAIKPFVDTIPGITTKKFETLAQKYNAYIVIGMAEVDQGTGIYYNSAALVGPKGYMGKYRKTHQWETEAHWAAWGDLGVPVFDTEIGKIAINICMDSAFFESSRIAALKGANILAFPTNSSAQALAALQARAVQNGLYIVSANRSNTENGFHMIGASAVWAPDGSKLAEAKFIPTSAEDVNEPTILYGTIDPAQYNNDGKKRLSERRPELYKDLVLYIGPWDYTKNTTPHDVTAVALQYEPVLGDKNANMAKIGQLIEQSVNEAKNQGKTVDLIVLPELSATGPLSDKGKVQQLAEPMDGSLVAGFKELAKNNQTHIIFGFAEKENDKLYNTAVLIDPKGEVIGKYRKTHLDTADKSWAEKGDKLEVFSTEIGKIGIMIGYDAAFPEVAGVLSVNRADIIAIPSSWNGQYGKKIEANTGMSANKYPENAMCLWDSIAMSAECYTLVANFVGTEQNYQGSSSLYTLDPLYGLDQPLALSQDGEEFLLADFTTIQASWWWNQEYLILQRRPHFYKPLVY